MSDTEAPAAAPAPVAAQDYSVESAVQETLKHAQHHHHRELLSPKKGVAVNTKHMPAYMRATAASSARKTKKPELSNTSVITKPKQQQGNTLPRPKTSMNATTSSKKRSFDPTLWARLATPKHVVKKPAAKAASRKTTSSVAIKKKPKTVKPKLKPKTPEPTKPLIVESQLGQKSCPREKPSQQMKQRRRICFSVNTDESNQNLDEWRQTDIGKMDDKQLWNSLSQEDSKSKTATEVLIVSF